MTQAPRKHRDFHLSHPELNKVAIRGTGNNKHHLDMHLPALRASELKAEETKCSVRNS